MSVQVGHVSIEYYPPLDSIVSEFVKELMWRKSVNCYMSGEGRVWQTSVSREWPATQLSLLRIRDTHKLG